MESNTYLTFVLGKELFAVNVDHVLKVLEEQYITPVPQAPAHVLGIINFRGEILAVINTHKKFNLSVEQNSMKSYSIVYTLPDGDQNYNIAATADAVKDVIEINNGELLPIPEMGIKYDTRFISGYVKRDDNFILVLNTEKLFSNMETEA
jgi:purine-binding chemotaxis protein CheW